MKSTRYKLNASEALLSSQRTLKVKYLNAWAEEELKQLDSVMTKRTQQNSQIHLRSIVLITLDLKMEILVY